MTRRNQPRPAHTFVEALRFRSKKTRVRYQPMRLALAFSVSFRTRPLDEVPKVMEESSNSSCLCSSSESSSMYQAERRPWLRVRIVPSAPSPVPSGSFRLVRCGAF